jgi:hypothetical protein
MTAFSRYVGIDYSGAKTPRASSKGLRVYMAEGDAAPIEVQPSPSPRKYWTRKGIAAWLVETLAEDAPTTSSITSPTSRYGFVFHDRTGASDPREANLGLDAFPSPSDLWVRYRAWGSVSV